jgi:leucyl-tRNA synthetase
MFIGDFEKTVSWSENGVKGCKRFLDRVWKLQEILVDDNTYSKENETKMHQTIKKVSNDYEKLKFNTAVAAMMELINQFYDVKKVTKAEYKTLLVLLNPVASHITEELWQILGFEGMLNQTTWPSYDESKTKQDIVELVVQVNGKILSRLSLELGSGEELVFEEAQKSEKVNKALNGKNIIKKIFVKDKLLNIVVK